MTNGVCDIRDCDEDAIMAVVGEAGELWVCAAHALCFG